MNRRRLKKARKKFWQRRPLTQKEEIAVDKYYMSKVSPFERTAYLITCGVRKAVFLAGKFFAHIARRLNDEVS